MQIRSRGVPCLSWCVRLPSLPPSCFLSSRGSRRVVCALALCSFTVRLRSHAIDTSPVDRESILGERVAGRCAPTVVR
eukprot:498119-Prorocentrum_minimum.AAC.1